MPELFTLLIFSNVAELDATLWLEIFEDLPDSIFQNPVFSPSSSVVEALKSYARAYTMLGDEGVVLN